MCISHVVGPGAGARADIKDPGGQVQGGGRERKVLVEELDLGVLAVGVVGEEEVRAWCQMSRLW